MTHAAPSSWRLREYATLPSTQDTAVQAARSGEPGRLAVLAYSQTDGRGSRGRGWVAPPGNLSMSILLRPERARPDPGYWAMLAGVVLHDALAQWASGLMLKWPNDVLRHGDKLGGVLIECGLADDGCLDWVVIGLGANLAHAPRIGGRPTACLPCPAPTADDVARAVLSQWDTHAPGDTRAAWLVRAHPQGIELDVVTPQRRVRGRFAGLTPAGELLLEGHAQPFGSADIFLCEPRAKPRVPCC